jgi:hypothetical protein
MSAHSTGRHRVADGPPREQPDRKNELDGDDNVESGFALSRLLTPTPERLRDIADLSRAESPPGDHAETTFVEVDPPPRSVPPSISSLPPPSPPRRTKAVPKLSADMIAEHPWLLDPRLEPLRGMIDDDQLVTLRRWGIDPTWTTNQIISGVHAMLVKKDDRRVFEALLAKCEDKGDLMQLAYSTLAEQLVRQIVKGPREGRRRQLAVLLGATKSVWSAVPR